VLAFTDTEHGIASAKIFQYFLAKARRPIGNVAKIKPIHTNKMKHFHK
jgi:hypothetical protein